MTSSFPSPGPLSRRSLLTATGALGLGTLLTACGDDTDTDPNSSASRGTWTFKDDRGTTAGADATPQRIVAYIGAAAALHDLGVECTGVFGPTKPANGEPDVQAGGVDVDKVTSARQRFEQASETLRTAARTAKTRGGIRVMAIAAQAELLCVGAPDAFTDLRYYKSLCVEFITPDKPSQDGFWQELSWENANTYDPDLILVDRRTGNLQPHELARTKPTWARLAAVAADQTAPWSNEARFSHAGYAPLIEQLAVAIGESKKVRA